MKMYQAGKILPIILWAFAIVALITVFVLQETTKEKEEPVNKREIIISQTISNPEMIEINPTDDGYYYIVYKPEGSVYIRDGKERSGKNTFPALHADGTPVTAWDLGVAEELGLGSRR